MACEARGGAARKLRIRRFEVGIPSEAESEAVVLSLTFEVSSSSASEGSVVLLECRDCGREGTKRSR